MKVVLFCGGLGMRIRDYADNIPKALVPIGNRPIIWHLMKYYAHFGHRDFILCLGYRSDAIKQYFLDYNEAINNDFVFAKGGKRLDLLHTDISDWTITFVDTGIDANVGQRLLAVQPHLKGEEVFLANYSDGLSDLPIPSQLEHFHSQQAVASFVCVRPNLSYHFVSYDADNRVTGIRDIGTQGVRINGGFFIFRQEIFDCINPGEELVEEPFERLCRQRRLLVYPYDGFWSSMDTFKDKQRFEDLYAKGAAPWMIWNKNGPTR